jgi:hypothetical protein
MVNLRRRNRNRTTPRPIRAAARPEFARGSLQPGLRWAAGYVRHFPGARHRFLIDHNPDVQMHVVPIPHVGSDVGSDTTRVWISKLEHLVRAMLCAPGRTRTYDRQIRRLLLYPLSYGGH